MTLVQYCGHDQLEISTFAAKVDYETTQIVIVPGGRNLVAFSHDTISILDLGYFQSADCKLISLV